MHKVARAAVWAAVCTLGVIGSRSASADILVNISKSSQRMSVLVDGTSRYNWAVSTGTKNYTTPSGVYKPQWLARKWFSKKYHNAPMPHSIFFHDGYAIHGTTEISRLGRIASHGCVRLHPENAAKLFGLVQKQMATTRVVVSDDAIDVPGEAPKKKTNKFVADAAPAKPEMRGLEAYALAPQGASVIENASEVKRGDLKHKPARTERSVRSSSGGFRW